MAQDREAPGDALLHRHGRVCSWDELPEPGRRAIERYVVGEGGGRIDPGLLYVYAEVPTAELAEAIMRFNADVGTAWTDFAAFHAWYERDNWADHGSSVWALIADQRGDEVVLDGWHRCHSYVRQGLDTIPMVGVHLRPELALDMDGRRGDDEPPATTTPARA